MDIGSSSRCTRSSAPTRSCSTTSCGGSSRRRSAQSSRYAQAWSYKEGNDPSKGYEQHGNRWTYALVQVAADDQTHRARLLDASLDALARDFRPSTLGWYANLHEALEPTPDERELRLERYLALLAVPAPAAMKAGLAGLRAAGDAVPAEALAQVAPGALTQKQKNIAVETLALLAEAAVREPQARPVVLAAVAQALGHERADVQERALALLEDRGSRCAARNVARVGRRRLPHAARARRSARRGSDAVVRRGTCCLDRRAARRGSTASRSVGEAKRRPRSRPSPKVVGRTPFSRYPTDRDRPRSCPWSPSTS